MAAKAGTLHIEVPLAGSGQQCGARGGLGHYQVQSAHPNTGASPGAGSSPGQGHNKVPSRQQIKGLKY